MSASDRSPVGDPSSDPTRDSDSALPRTYVRTDGDELVQMREVGCESNARESENHAIGVIDLARSLRFAEVNGAKVIAAVDLPEPVLHALATLVDAISQTVGEKNDRERQADADRTRTMCRYHLGQFADYCSGCRAEEIEAYRRRDEVPPPTSSEEGRRRARELYEQTRREAKA